jgi:glycosyltransferase involved in cell wall biosynthesis
MVQNISLSIVTPAYNESKNLPVFYRQMSAALDKRNIDWEWIIVDDNSSDSTSEVMTLLSAQDPRVRGLRLARNYGAHRAATCGLNHCRGACAVLMASDLQDPPEHIPELIEKWQEGAHVVWAARRQREGQKKRSLAFSHLYYIIVRQFLGLKNLPATGADFFLLDRKVYLALQKFPEKTGNLVLLIAWMGFSQARIEYDKKERLYGQSGWSLAKKINLVIDSVTTFSSMPLRVMTLIGLATSLIGFLFMLHLLHNLVVGNPPAGWTSIMCAIMLIGGTQMGMLGVLGEYVWRALEESRNRPTYIVEKIFGIFPESDPNANFG